jgi:hypothetical protein
VNRPFTYPGHVPDRFATAVSMIQCQAGTRETARTAPEFLEVPSQWQTGRLG